MEDGNLAGKGAKHHLITHRIKVKKGKMAPGPNTVQEILGIDIFGELLQCNIDF